MTDIVERLRWWAYKFCGKGVQEDDASDVMTNAIQEIEKLRRENEIMVGMINDMATIVIKARAALGEKK